MKFEIGSRWTNQVKFSAEISCDESAIYSAKVGLAIRWALENGADLCYADLCGANLRGANLRGANLRGANLRGANLRDADLRDADLRGANLRDADLRDANLCGANLRDANLRGADLRGADLCYADLCGANLRGANLRDADLRGADLRGADLCYADLCGADLCGADLRGANLRGAKNLKFLPIQISGHRHSLQTTQEGTLQIGCYIHTFDEWRESADAIGKREGYSPIDVEIYKLHIAHIERVSRLLWAAQKTEAVTA